MKIKKYIQKLIDLVKLEREAEIEAMKEEMRALSPKEREKVGRAILDLKGKIVGREFEFLLVKYQREREIQTEIEVGDLVLISKQNPLLSNLYGTVVEKRKKSIVVALEFVPKWAQGKVRIDLAANDITFRRQIENLKKLSNFGFLALKFLLKKEKPRKSKFLYFDSQNKKLNKDQRQAVSLALGSKDFFLIHGPFGTGKTTTLAELILQEVERGKRVLACAESNVAVDNIVEKLYKKARIVRVGHPSRVSKDLKETTLSFLVQRHPDYRNVLKLREELEKLKNLREKFLKPTKERKRGLSRSEILRLAMKGKTKRGISSEEIKRMAQWIKLDKEIQKVFRAVKAIENWIVKEIIKKAEVILSTNSSAALEFLENEIFDVAIIDEASQTTIPSCLIPLAKAKKFILAGDHKQLPPTIMNERAFELSETLFEKLIKIYPQKSEMLKIQYRMNEVLMKFPSFQFYGGKIKSFEKVKKISLRDLKLKRPNFDSFFNFILDFKKPLVFVDTAKIPEKWESQREGSTSRENHFEAFLVMKILKKFLKIGAKRNQIGVITPYDDQVKLIRSLLEDEKCEVKSVDGYQGREKEIIIISFVRSNKEGELGFLEDLRRLNVSLTRAKRKLIAIGDSETLSKNKVYKSFIEFCKKVGGYIEV